MKLIAKQVFMFHFHFFFFLHVNGKNEMVIKWTLIFNGDEGDEFYGILRLY